MGKRSFVRRGVDKVRYLLRGALQDRRAAGRLRRAETFVRFVNLSHPLVRFRFLSVGARRGIDGLDGWTLLSNVHLEGFEPDRAEAEALEADPAQRFSKVHPVALSDSEGRRTLYVTKVLGCTSIRRPIEDRLKAYSVSRWFSVQRTLEIPVTTLASFYPTDTTFDFILIDAQGEDYGIIRGGEAIIRRAIGLTLEARFVQIYEGERLFPELHELCLSLGFRLLDISPPGPGFDGEFVEANITYVKDPELLRDKEELLKAIVFAYLSGNNAYCELLLRTRGSVLLTTRELQSLLDAVGVELKPKHPGSADGVAAHLVPDGSGYDLQGGDDRVRRTTDQSRSGGGRQSPGAGP